MSIAYCIKYSVDIVYWALQKGPYNQRYMSFKLSVKTKHSNKTLHTCGQ